MSPTTAPSGASPGATGPLTFPGPVCGSAGLDPEGIRRVVCGVARPGVAPAAPAAPVPLRGGRRRGAGVARGPRARAGVAAAPQGAGRLLCALTQVCGPRADVRRGHRDPPPPLPTHPSRGTATSLPPLAHGRGRECTACMAGRYAEPGPPSSAPRGPMSLKIGPQIKSNQIKSNHGPPPNTPLPLSLPEAPPPQGGLGLTVSWRSSWRLGPRSRPPPPLRGGDTDLPLAQRSCVH